MNTEADLEIKFIWDITINLYKIKLFLKKIMRGIIASS